MNKFTWSELKVWAGKLNKKLDIWLEWLTVGRMLGIMGVIIAAAAFQVQVWQFSSDVKAELWHNKIDSQKEENKSLGLLAAFAIELRNNKTEADAVIHAYEKNKSVGLPATYSSDIYKAILTSGDFIFIKDKARDELQLFYGGMPSYDAFVVDGQAMIRDSQNLLNQCKIIGQGDCSGWEEKVKNAKASFSLSLYEVSKKDSQQLGIALTNLEYAK